MVNNLSVSIEALHMAIAHCSRPTLSPAWCRDHSTYGRQSEDDDAQSEQEGLDVSG
jgi:hypothetical protein